MDIDDHDDDDLKFDDTLNKFGFRQLPKIKEDLKKDHENIHDKWEFLGLYKIPRKIAITPFSLDEYGFIMRNGQDNILENGYVRLYDTTIEDKKIKDTDENLKINIQTYINSVIKILSDNEHPLFRHFFYRQKVDREYVDRQKKRDEEKRGTVLTSNSNGGKKRKTKSKMRDGWLRG